MSEKDKEEFEAFKRGALNTTQAMSDHDKQMVSQRHSTS